MGNSGSTAMDRASSSRDVVTSDYKYNSSFKASRGNAKADLVDGGRTAVAMAQGRKGSAYAWTDGKYMDYGSTGNGRVVVGKGVAHAMAGSKNQALAYSSKAERKESNRLGGRDGGLHVSSGGKGRSIW